MSHISKTATFIVFVISFQSEIIQAWQNSVSWQIESCLGMSPGSAGSCSTEFQGTTVYSSAIETCASQRLRDCLSSQNSVEVGDGRMGADILHADGQITCEDRLSSMREQCGQQIMAFARNLEASASGMAFEQEDPFGGFEGGEVDGVGLGYLGCDPEASYVLNDGSGTPLRCVPHVGEGNIAVPSGWGCVDSNGAFAAPGSQYESGGATMSCGPSGTPTLVSGGSAPGAEPSPPGSGGGVEPSAPGGDDESIADGGSGGSSGPATQADVNACETAYSNAYDCCTNPMGCIMGGENQQAASAVGTGMEILTQGIGIVAGSGALGMDQLCKLMNGASNVNVGIQSVSAAVCASKKAACTRACRAAGTPETCNTLNEEIGKSAQQAISSMVAAKMANNCSQLAGNGLEQGDIDFNVDCSDPQNASSPYCRDCNGPTAANNPFCRNHLAMVDNSQSAYGSGDGTEGAGFGGSGDGSFHNVDVGDDIDEQFNLGEGAQANASSAGIGSAPGGSAPSSGAAAGGGDGDGQPGGGGGGYDTNVLKGAQGGGGYTAASTSRVRYGSGGGGFNYGGAKKPKNTGLDLKQFLPGGKKNKLKGRRLASMGGADTKIRRKEGNIFHNMSMKFRQMCKLKRLDDCPKLPKR